MSELTNALPVEGSIECAQKRKLPDNSIGRYRRFLVLTLGFCLLLADGFLWHGPSAGLTAAVFAWYALTLAWLGQAALARRSSRVLLLMNLFLALTMALGSNVFFRWWNTLALLALIPIQAMEGLGCQPWWKAEMLAERCGLLFQGLFGNLWACFAAAAPPEKKPDGKPRRTMTIVLGTCGAAALVSVLLPVLMSADALFAASAAGLQPFMRSIQVSGLLQRLFWALALTPFVYSLLYSMGQPKLLCPAKEEKGLRLDALGFALMLAAVDGLYLAFLAVQSAGLFGGPVYLAARGISYAEWARSGFFQMVGVTIVNLSLMLVSLCLSRREGRDWTILRGLCALLAGQSTLLLASAAWRMTLYVSAYGLSFKRLMTYWGMVMMALFLLAGLWKVGHPDFRFCKWAFPIALAGWLVINCVPVDYLVAKDQVHRCLAVEAHGGTPVVDTHYLLGELSYDTLHQLSRLDSRTPAYDWRTGKTVPLGDLLQRRREEAQAECSDWHTWSLSACLVIGGLGK